MALAPAAQESSSVSTAHPFRGIPVTRYVPATVTAVIGAIMSVVSYLAVENSQRRITELNFIDIAKNQHHTLNADLEDASNVLYTLRDYFESNDRPVSRAEFQAFASSLRKRLVGLRNTGWAPRVTAGDREAFERAVRDSGVPDFEIWERNADGKRVRASNRTEYYPVLYRDPVEFSSQILGLDLAADNMPADKMTADTLRRARDSSRPAATSPRDLIVGGEAGIVSDMPVYDKAADQNGNPRVLKGFVTAVFVIGPMIENILASKTRPAGLDIYFFAADESGGERPIYWHSSRTRVQPAAVPDKASLLAGPHWQGTLKVADRTWSTIFAPTDKLIASTARWTAIATLAVSLTMTVLIVAYVLIKLLHAVRLEALSANLKAANDDLLALRAAFHQLDIGIVLLDQDLRAQFINQKVRREWVLSDQQVEGKPTFETLIRHAVEKGLFAEPPSDLEIRVTGLVARVRSGGAISEDFELGSGEVIRFRSVVSPGGGRMLSSSNVTDLVRLAERLRLLANVDALTGVANRRHFAERAEVEWSRFTRSGQPLSLMALDLDLFKSINDQFGHDVGDEVIRMVASTCAEAIRIGDVLGRMGGEEFAIMLPNSDLEHARVAADRIRQQVEQLDIHANGQVVHVSVSIGVAQADAGTVDVGALSKRADEALYKAKRSGRNCVIQAVPDVGTEPHIGLGASIAVGVG